jgi:hypothetical protein
MDLWNTTLGYGLHFQHRKCRTVPIEKFAHDSGHTLVHADNQCGYPKESLYTTVKEEIRHYSSQYGARLSAHPNNLLVK